MAEKTKTKISSSLLPKGWKAQAAEEFNISEALVYGIAAGLRNNQEVFAYLLDLAEEKRAADLLVTERLTALNQ